MIKLLLIDNDKKVADSLYDTADRFGFEIEDFQGLEEGLVELESRPWDFQGIILDGMGWMSEDKPKEVSRHVHEAIRRIREMRAQNIFIPYVIHTGHFERIYDQIPEEESELIFEKTKSIEPMFQKLRELINALPNQRLKLKYPDAYSVFGGKYLPIASHNKMHLLLGSLEQGSFRQTDFNVIRDLIEEMLKRANAIDNKSFLPDALLKIGPNARLNLKAAELFLSGRKVDFSKLGLGAGELTAAKSLFTPHISWLFSSTINNSQILSHNYNFGVTKYAFQSSVFALVEILIWFKDYVDDNYPDL